MNYIKKPLFLSFFIICFFTLISCVEAMEVGFTGSPHSPKIFKQRLEEIYNYQWIDSSYFKSFAASSYTLEEFDERIIEIEDCPNNNEIPSVLWSSYAGSSHTIQQFKERIEIFKYSSFNKNEDLASAFMRSTHSYNIFRRRYEEILNEKDIDWGYHGNYAFSYYTLDDFRKRIELFENDPDFRGTGWY